MINNKIKVEIKSKEKSKRDTKKRCHLFGHFNSKVFSEMQEFRKYLSYLSKRYGVKLKCLDSWRQEFQETVWQLFTVMLLEKLEEPNECLSKSPVMVIPEKESIVAGADGSDSPVISCYDALKVNTVSSIYRYSQSKYDFNPRRLPDPERGYNPEKSVPRVNFSGLWLRDYGFEKGKKYVVYGFKNHLVLKIADCNFSVGLGLGVGLGLDSVDSKSEIPDKIEAGSGCGCGCGCGDRIVKDSSITIGRINS